MSDLKFVFRVGELKEFLQSTSQNDEDLFQIEVDFKATEGVIKPTIVGKIKGNEAHELPGIPDPPGIPIPLENQL